MESFFDFLVIAGIIIVGVFKEIRKEKPEATRKPTVSPVPDPVDIFTDPLSDDSFSKEPFSEDSFSNQTDSTEKTPRSTCLHSTLNSTPTPSPEAEPEEDFSIHSIEEARKAIIWGEIMQRKY